jgi:hypothetical protein
MVEMWGDVLGWTECHVGANRTAAGAEVVAVSEVEKS